MIYDAKQIKRVLVVILSIALFTTISCKDEPKERDCECSMDELVTIQVDSIVVSDNNNEVVKKLKGKFTSEINKILDAELEGNWQSGEKNGTTKKIIREINNTFPEFDCEILQNRISKLYYCAFYYLCCKDTSLSTSDIRKKCEVKLKEFKQEAQMNCNEEDNPTSGEDIEIDGKEEPPSSRSKVKIRFNLDENMIGSQIFVDGDSANILDERGTTGTDGHVLVWVYKREKPYVFIFKTRDNKCYKVERPIEKYSVIRNYDSIKCN